jgi:hypothetical protein
MGRLDSKHPSYYGIYEEDAGDRMIVRENDGEM